MTTPKSPTLAQVVVDIQKLLTDYMGSRHTRYYVSKNVSGSASWSVWCSAVAWKVCTLGLHPDITCRSLVTNTKLTGSKVNEVDRICKLMSYQASNIGSVSVLLMTLADNNYRFESLALKVSRTEKQAKTGGGLLKATFFQSGLQQTIGKCEQLVEKYKEQNSAALKTEEPVPVAVAVAIRQG